MRKAVTWTAVGVIPAAFIAVFFVWPVATLVGRGFVDESGVNLAGFAEVFSRGRTWRIVSLTLGQAVIGTVLCVLLGLPGAYLLYRVRFPGRHWLRGLVTIPFVLPSVVVGVMLKTLLLPTGPLGFLNLDESFIAIIAALVFFNYSVIVRTVGSMWAGLDPRPAEAARTLGASGPRVFFTVTLPSLGPAIASGASLVFLFCASAYGVVMVLGGVRYGTIETEIWFQTTQLLDLRAAAALSIVQLVVVTLSLLVAGRSRSRTEQALRLRSDASGEVAWRAARDWPAALVTAIVVGGLLLVPILSMAWRSLQAPDGFGLGNYRNLATTGTGALTVPVWQAVGNSLVIAVQATLIALTLGLLVTVLISRRPTSRWGRGVLAGVDGLFMLPLGVSAVTVGFGFLITLNRPPLDLRSSMVLVPIAQAIVALPLVVRTLLPLLRALDQRQLEAAATLGSPPLEVFWRVEVPQLWRGLGLAIGFAFATSLGEFGATSFLSRPDRPTLPTVIFRLIGRPGEVNYGMAMASATLLAIMTGAVMALAERVRPKEATTW